MVGAAYVGGCTVTFMALQVSRDVAVHDHDTCDGFNTFFASSDSAQAMLHLGNRRCVIIGMDHSSLPQHTLTSGGLAASADINHFDSSYVSTFTPQPIFQRNLFFPVCN
jgi:hypothetical protein